MLEYIGENIIKLDIDEIVRLEMKHIIFDDKINNVYWAVVPSDELIFVYKRRYEIEDEPHENEGIAVADCIYDVLDDIKDFYEINIDPKEIYELLEDKEIELDSLKEIVSFVERIFKSNSLAFEFDSWIEQIKSNIINFEKKKSEI